MGRISYLTAFVAILCTGWISPHTEAGTTPLKAGEGQIFAETDCPFTLPETQKAICGFLVVPENREHADSRTIKIMVVILEAIGKDVEADPLVILAGGPGGKFVEFIPDSMPFFELFLEHRDVVVFDQRGVGFSEPALECPQVTKTMRDLAQVPIEEEEYTAKIFEAVRLCRSDVTSSGIDLNSYNTIENAADVEALRMALGYSKINLFGGSYGTRLALEVMRKYPDGIRSAILDAVYPTQINLYQDSGDNFQRALEKLFNTCDENLWCKLAYPDLRDVFYETVMALNRNPKILEGIDPISGTRIDAILEGWDLVELLSNNLYVTSRLGYLPALIYDIHDGDFEQLKKLIWTPLSTGEPISLGMFFSTQCAEDGAFAKTIGNENDKKQPSIITEYMSRSSFMGGKGIALCEIWDVEAVPSGFKGAVSSDIPILILGGEFDPVIPPSYASLASKTMNNSFTYIFPGIGHGSLSGGLCPTHIATSFLDNPNRKPMDACLATMATAPTFLIRSQTVKPYALASIGLLAGYIGYWTWRGKGYYLGKKWKSAWKSSIKRVGWIPLAGTFAVTGLVVFWAQSPTYIDALPQLGLHRVIPSLIPLAAGCHLSFILFQDENPLELLLICPRPFPWIYWERVGLLSLGYGFLALAGITSVSWIEGDGALFRIQLNDLLPPLMFLCGASAVTTLITRRAAFGMGLTILLWFGMTTFPDMLIIRWPFLWPIQIYLQPGVLSNPNEYTLNRIFVSLAGLGLLYFGGTQLLRSHEKILTGIKS